MTSLNLHKHLFQLVIIFNLFSLEFIRKCQHYYLCALRENSIKNGGLNLFNEQSL